MKFYSFFAAAVSLTTVVACGNAATETAAYPPAFSTPAASTQTQATPMVQDTSKPSSPLDVLPTANNSGSSSSVALNPEHGQPGHRCELAVGAPLNSGATSQPASQPVQTQPTVQSQPQPVQVQPVTTSAPAKTTASTKGLNPAHGEPGHRCEIAVGAPLNSAPQTANQVITTDAPKPASTNTAANTGLNPAHGEPGHRCDIAVGAPLKN